jgi:NADH-ubiquinone oxidoreductase chain 4
MNILSWLIIVPIIGSFLIIPINEKNFIDRSNRRMRSIALIASVINFILSLYLWWSFDSSCTHFQFVNDLNKISFCDFYLGVDGISLYFVLLTTFLTPIAILSNYKNIDKHLKYFLISLLLLETLQILTFVSLDLFLFYIFFESVLPILFFLIIVYGSGENKTRSALLLFLYTLLGSLPMLLSILSIQSILGSTDFLFLSLLDINLESQKLLWLGFFIAFAIKTPLWPVSRWLPLAHADSPLAGSIILAGTILKLASYGLLRILLTFLPDATYYFSPLVQTIAIITIIYASLSTIIQQDTKTLIAYSSICHMSVVILGIFSNNIIGIEGAVLLSIAHGLVSPALFICVGGIIYDRTGIRLIRYIKGLVLYMPVFTILFFIFSLANMATPLTLNFIGEQMSLIGIWSVNPIIAIFGASGIILSACYSIYLYNRISYTSFSPHLEPLKDISRIEYMTLISLLIPTIILGIYPNIILETLHLSVHHLLHTTLDIDLNNIINYDISNVNKFADLDLVKPFNLESYLQINLPDQSEITELSSDLDLDLLTTENTNDDDDTPNWIKIIYPEKD